MLKIRVRNSAAPFDELPVKAWVSIEQGVRVLNFEDGDQGIVATQTIESFNP